VVVLLPWVRNALGWILSIVGRGRGWPEGVGWVGGKIGSAGLLLGMLPTQKKPGLVKIRT
jgi:hypothetical protein